MPVRQINVEALESRFVISDSDLSINPFGPVQWAHKIILHDWLVKHGSMCAHTERGVRYLHRKSSIHLSLKEASTQLASHADVLRGAWQAKRTSAWEATKRRTTPWTPAVILVSAVLQVDNSLRLQTLSTGPTSCPWWGVRAQFVCYAVMQLSWFSLKSLLVQYRVTWPVFSGCSNYSFLNLWHGAVSKNSSTPLKKTCCNKLSLVRERLVES